MSTMEKKYNRNQVAVQMKILAASKEAPADSDSDASHRVPCKKMTRTCVLTTQKQEGEKNPKHKGSEHCCVLCKKAGITERK